MIKNEAIFLFEFILTYLILDAFVTIKIDSYKK